MISSTAFDSDFESLTGNQPFPWQRELFDRLVAERIPSACDLPTGMGKTSVIHVWLLALARNAHLPRRLVYVVNRRTVVDQATAEAERLAERLLDSSTRRVRDELSKLAAVPTSPHQPPLAISTLRGERADNGEWRRDPACPSVIIGTVDMVGSRLLFSGYGCGFRSKPLHAGFLGQDVLLVHDEAHLEPAFQQLLVAIRAEQVACAEMRPLHVLALSATVRGAADLSLTKQDEQHEVVRKRLDAKKGLTLVDIEDRAALVERVATHAAGLSGRVLVFLSRVEEVEKCAAALRSQCGKEQVAVLTGTMRGHERDQLVRSPVFARFLPRPSAGIVLREGTVFLVATAAGEVGIDLSADHMVSDLPPFDSLAQRLGRVNRYGDGDATVTVFCEPIAEPVKPVGGETGSEDEGDDDEESEGGGEGGEGDDDAKPTRGRKEDFERSRYLTRQLVQQLPKRADQGLDASPAAIRALAMPHRLAASTPEPEVRAVDDLLFDRWSYTTIVDTLAGRPPVAEWLHGVAEWELPRTTIAWRREVTWLEEAHLGDDSLAEFLSDYPLRSRETLSDRTDRVVKHLRIIVERDESRATRAWLLRNGAPAEFWRLPDLLEKHDPKRNPLLHGATVVLSPEAGGLRAGLLDGKCQFEKGEDATYDLGPRDGERVVLDVADAEPPSGMRLVRSVLRLDEDEKVATWRLYAAPRNADDEGSRTSRSELRLDDHLRRTECWARRIAERLGLPQALCETLALAGRWHDLGKRRRVWQRSIKNFGEPALAKGRMNPSELSHYRHELGSLNDALRAPEVAALPDDVRELALHLVAAHHGRARPHFPAIEAFDPEVRDDVIASLVEEVPLRFDRLQRKYGRWGLAWLESLLRAADVLGSDGEEVAS